MACGARVLCVCVCWSRACVCVAARAPECAVWCTVLCVCLLCCAVLLLLMGSVLYMWRCAGVRRARAVRACVLESCVRLHCCARACVCCMMSVLLCACLLCCGAQAWLAGLRSGLRRAAGGGVVVRVPDGVRRPRNPPDRVVGGPGREHVDCAACEAAARLARMFPCDEGRA